MKIGNSSGMQKFLEAQVPIYTQVMAELAAGHKHSHWMWFIFPQLKSLGRSATAQHFGLADMTEALEYLRHPVLGHRLRECAALVLATPGTQTTAHDIFGSPDDLKLRSCMTLFEAAAPEEPIFAQVLERFYDGKRDDATLRLLGR